MRIRLLFFFCWLAGALAAQPYNSRIHHKVRIGDEQQLHQLILLDYSKLLGTALEVGRDSIYFQLRSSAEVSVIPTEELRFLGLFAKASGGGFGLAGKPVGLTDMTFERTALPFKTKAQLRIVQVVYAMTEWNLNNNIQLGVGLFGPLAFLTTQKLRFSLSPEVHVGLSNQLAFPPFSQGFNDGTPLIVGDATAMLTLGNENRFLHLGTGYFYNTDRFVRDETTRLHRVGIGGKIGSRWHLYSEAVLVATSDNDVFRGRTFRELALVPSVNAALTVRSHRWHFGIATVMIDQESIFPPPIPYVGYSLYWGN